MTDHGSIVHGRMYEDGPFYPRQYVPPGGAPSVDADALTDEQLAAFAAEWRRKAGGPPKLLTPLPRRVRARLAVTHAIDGAAIWLASRKRYGAAEWLWRMFRVWRS